MLTMPVASGSSLKHRSTPDDKAIMAPEWSRGLFERMIAGQNADGGFGYRSGGSPFAEPTALACLALRPKASEARVRRAGLVWLARHQRADGSVPITAGDHLPAWTTGLAVLAWATTHENLGEFKPQIDRAVEWLLSTSGKPVRHERSVYGHDGSLCGWPWVRETHSWVEPTAYAVLALKAAGHFDHPRTREAVRLLLDRMFPDGGCNYGNTSVLGNRLRPFPATTGLALAALQWELNSARMEASIAYLLRELPRLRAPLSLSWGCIGLSAQNSRPPAARDWLRKSSIETDAASAGGLELTLVLLASQERSLLFHAAPSPKH